MVERKRKMWYNRRMKIKFSKMHGLGNDFILVDERGETLKEPSSLAKRLCDRRTGIGADGLILVKPSEAADIRMQIMNSDGSEAQMCGNGIRCFARYVYETGILQKESMRIETLAGIREAERMENGDIRICMGAPEFLSEGLCELELDGERIAYWPLVMGVPHAVVPVSDPLDRKWMAIGARMEWAAPFPQGTNVDFIRIDDKENITMRVFERGCGETLCCGTGATSAALCAMREGKAEPRVQVHLTLGALTIEKQGALSYMTGPAAFVYEGETEV